MRLLRWAFSGWLALLTLVGARQLDIELDLQLRAGREPTTVQADRGLAYVSIGDAPPPCFDPATVPGFGRVPDFVTDRVDLPPDGAYVVARILDSVQQEPCLVDADGRACPTQDVVYDIRGHADDRVSHQPGGNDALSLGRAQSVADLLWVSRVTVGTIEGLGDKEPAEAPVPDQRSNEERWADDRRVVITPRC